MPVPLHGSALIRCLCHRDAHAMIDRLCRAFGFEKHAAYDDDAGGVAHAQLVHGRGMLMLVLMLMLGSVRDDAFGRRIAQPDETGGRETQCTCVVVADCKAHCDHARAIGAEIVDDYEEKDYGGAGYSCRDPEGHLWSFGSYDPWQSA
ncbi:VOC family protein [Rhodanobacter geophilus]|uniref:VOC family protein n=1 Tax=Rhodanobacter geophilus TaxID=3162488 RepID=A0ABV3QQL6_9GAMM